MTDQPTNYRKAANLLAIAVPTFPADADPAWMDISESAQARRVADAQVYATLAVADAISGLDDSIRDLHETLRSYHR